MLEIKDIKKEYPAFTLHCSLQVPSGQITALIGQNGAGKSTTFKAILHLIEIDAGTIQIFGKEQDQLTSQDKERIGVVLSDSGFSGYLKVQDIQAILQAMYQRFDTMYFQSLMQRFGLPWDKPVKSFSTGMKNKLKVICAIAHHPDLLILDEPTSGLDVVARDEVLDLLREYMEEGNRSILISSHISSDLESLCDDVYMIQNGEIILHEDMDTILACYGVLKVTKEQYESLDKKYILAVCKEQFGYACLTDQVAYYKENNPDIVIEKGSIDEIMTLRIRGEEI